MPDQNAKVEACSVGVGPIRKTPLAEQVAELERDHDIDRRHNVRLAHYLDNAHVERNKQYDRAVVAESKHAELVERNDLQAKQLTEAAHIGVRLQRERDEAAAKAVELAKEVDGLRAKLDTFRRHNDNQYNLIRGKTAPVTLNLSCGCVATASVETDKDLEWIKGLSLVVDKKNCTGICIGVFLNSIKVNTTPLVPRGVTYLINLL